MSCAFEHFIDFAHYKCFIIIIIIITTRGEYIPTLTVSQVYKYLRVTISPQGTMAAVAEILQEGLNNISAAQLKPQQRLYLASCHLILKLQHQLTLTSSSAKYLKWLNWTTQSAVRSCLKLPKDTPTAYFHARAVDGGLNIPTEHAIPLAKQSHIARMVESQDTMISVMINTLPALELLHAKQTTLDSSVVATRQGLRGLLANQLHRSVDGRGLVRSSQVPS